MNDRIVNISLLGVIGLCFSACVDAVDMPEADPKEYISFATPQLTFQSEVNGFTRAELVDEVSQFTVYGYCIPQTLQGNLNKNQAVENWDVKARYFTKGADVLDGYVVNVNGNQTYYSTDVKTGVNSNTASKPQKWYAGAEHPNADDYNYAFIATTSPSGTFSMSHENDINNGYPVVTFDMPWPENSTLNTELDYTAQPDALIGTKFDQFNNSKVTLTFQHIMTGLRFQFYNECTAEENDKKELVIHNVTFSGEFYKQTRFIFDKEKFRREIVTRTKKNDKGEDEEIPVTYSGTFNLLSKDQTIEAGKSAIMRHDGDPNGRTVKLLLLPNTNATLDPGTSELDNWALGTNKKITIEYSISGGDKKTFVLESLQLKYIPEVNNLYTANFHFVGNDFIVTFQAENEWENGCDSKLEIH